MAAAHCETCDLSHPATPSAAVAIAQAHGDSLRYLVLGDTALAIDTTDGLRIITDNRVDTTATAERAAADAPTKQLTGEDSYQVFTTGSLLVAEPR
jgi:hypothetical protein